MKFKAVLSRNWKESRIYLLVPTIVIEYEVGVWSLTIAWLTGYVQVEL